MKQTVELPKLVQACAKGDEATVTRLLSEGASADRDPRTAVSPLFAAACEGQAGCLKVLLQQGPVKIDDGDSLGRSPLYAACVNGHMQCAGMLAAKGANIATGGGPDGGGALHAACRADAPKIIGMLFQMLTPEDIKTLFGVRDKDGRTALHVAVQTRSLECVDMLLKKSADANAVDSQLLAPLHVACQQGLEEIAEMLLEAKASPVAQDSLGRTPLHYAAMYGHSELVELLLTDPEVKAEVDVNALDNYGLTPFLLSSMYNHTSCVRILTERGCNVRATDSSGHTAMHCAAYLGSASAANVLLTRHNLGVDELDATGRTPLFVALSSPAFAKATEGSQQAADQQQQQQQPYNRMIDWLLENGCDVSVRDKTHSRSALHWACRLGNLRAAKAIVAAAQRQQHTVPLVEIVDAHDSSERSPVHLAAAGGYAETLAYLLGLVEGGGASVMVSSRRDKRGMTPLYLATARGHAKCVELLLQVHSRLSPQSLGELLACAASSPAGVAPVHIAAFKGHLESLRLLCEALPAGVMLPKGARGRNPLHYAASGGDVECVRYLLTRDAQLAEERDANGDLSVDLAAYFGHRECVECLLSTGPRDVSVLFHVMFRAVLSSAISLAASPVIESSDSLDASSQIKSVAASASKDIFEAVLSDCTAEEVVELLKLHEEKGGRNLVHALCHSGDVSMLDSVLSACKGTPIALDDRDSEGFSPLHYAVASGDSSIVQYVMSRSSVPDCLRGGNNGVTPLMIAANNGDVDSAEALLLQAEPDELTKLLSEKDAVNQLTALMVAVIKNRGPFVELLLEKASAASPSGVTALVVNDKDKAGRNAIHYAAFHGHMDCLAAITDFLSAELKKDKGLAGKRRQRLRQILDIGDGLKGETPLMMASFGGHTGIMTHLLGHGVRLFHRSAVTRRTALHLACIGGHASSLSKLLETAATAPFASHVKFINRRDKRGMTALHLAAHNGHPHICLLLLQQQAQAQAQGQTDDVVQKDALDQYWRTPLMYAALNGDALVISRLIDNGANPSIPDKSGKLPAQYARKLEHTHCAELLEGRREGFTYVTQVRVLFDFTARDASEISIKPGDLINVLWQHESGWWKGELQTPSEGTDDQEPQTCARAGLFPSNYCEPIPAEQQVLPPRPEAQPQAAAVVAPADAAPTVRESIYKMGEEQEPAHDDLRGVDSATSIGDEIERDFQSLMAASPRKAAKEGESAEEEHVLSFSDIIFNTSTGSAGAAPAPESSGPALEDATPDRTAGGSQQVACPVPQVPRETNVIAAAEGNGPAVDKTQPAASTELSPPRQGQPSPRSERPAVPIELSPKGNAPPFSAPSQVPPVSPRKPESPKKATATSTPPPSPKKAPPSRATPPQSPPRQVPRRQSPQAAVAAPAKAHHKPASSSSKPAPRASSSDPGRSGAGDVHTSTTRTTTTGPTANPTPPATPTRAARTGGRSPAAATPAKKASSGGDLVIKRRRSVSASSSPISVDAARRALRSPSRVTQPSQVPSSPSVATGAPASRSPPSSPIQPAGSPPTTEVPARRRLVSNHRRSASDGHSFLSRSLTFKEGEALLPQHSTVPSRAATTDDVFSRLYMDGRRREDSRQLLVQAEVERRRLETLAGAFPPSVPPSPPHKKPKL